MNDTVIQALVQGSYLLSAILFILGIKKLTKVRSSRQGNTMAGVAMLIAVVATLVEIGSIDYRWIIGGMLVGGVLGLVSAIKVPMTKMPEMVAIFNGFGGASSALVGMSLIWRDVVEAERHSSLEAVMGLNQSVTLILSIIIGMVTLTGSIIAYLKLAEVLPSSPILLPARHVLNALLLVGGFGLGAYAIFSATSVETIEITTVGLSVAALLLGVSLVIPIGGADMPVVISLLNSYSGVAASATGFAIGNNLLIISGALVGPSGLILTKIMCVAMNRSLANVIFGGFGAQAESGGAKGGGEYVGVTSAGAEETAMMLEDAESVIFVPGYGLAVAQAQHAVRELASILEKRGAKVTYAIHPVAGRMPGHMNVLLAEADVPYEQLIEMDEINSEFKNTDVVIVIGANDVVNPAALHDKTSPIYGMPILTVHEARSVFVIKRSLGAGFAGIKNELFEAKNTSMVFGDAKKVIQTLVQELKSAH